MSVGNLIDSILLSSIRYKEYLLTYLDVVSVDLRDIATPARPLHTGLAGQVQQGGVASPGIGRDTDQLGKY